MKINRAELIAVLEAVRPGLASKEVVEQSTAFVFQRGRAYTYNDLIAVSHPCPSELSGAVPSKELHAFLTKSGDEEIDVETTDNEMSVKGKRNKAVFPIQADITLPIAEVSAKKTWMQLPAGFTDAVKFVLFSASDDMTKPWSTAVHVEGLVVETCDNFRLTRYTLGAEKKKKGIDDNVLVPAQACAALVKYEPTHYSIDDQWIHFTNKQGTEFSCRTVADKFPDLQPFVDRQWKHKIEFHEDTVAILDRAQVFLAADNDVMPTVSVKVSAGRMTIAARGSAGCFEETVRVLAGKNDFQLEIDPRALKDMLPLLRDCELSDDKSVLKFEGDDFVHCCATRATEDKK